MKAFSDWIFCISIVLNDKLASTINCSQWIIYFAAFESIGWPKTINYTMCTCTVCADTENVVFGKIIGESVQVNLSFSTLVDIFAWYTGLLK